MIRFLNGTYSIVIVLCVIAAIVIYSSFSERGLFKVISLKSELQEIEELNSSLQSENEDLKEGIKLLKKDSAYIEKLAREELGLLEREEFVYFFENE